MAYTTPSTFVAGEVLTAAQMNTNVRDNVAFLARPPSAKVHRDAAQTINNNTWTAIQFDTERWDTDTIWSSTANERFNINTNGKYLVQFSFQFQNSSGGVTRAMAIQVDSTSQDTTKEGFALLNNAADFPNQFWGGSISDTFSLTSTQFVSFLVFQDSGGTLASATSIGGQPRAVVTWVSS